jgi:hypothetical protein
MQRSIFALFVLAAMAFSVDGSAYKRVPIGQWRVEFSNRVVQTVDVARNGEATVSEPLRRAKANPEVTGPTTVVFKYSDDRVERWTRVGAKHVVEHWYPAQTYPSGVPELGIAERTR